MIKLPLWMRLLNWWDVRVRGKTVVRGIIRYAPPGSGGFRPEFDAPPTAAEHMRKGEFIEKGIRPPATKS